RPRRVRTPLRSGPDGGPPVSGRGRRRPAARAMLAAAAVLVLVLGLATPASAQEPDDGAAEPAPGAAPGPQVAPALDLVSQTPFVAPTDTFRIGLDVEGAPEGAELAFTMHLSIETPRPNGDTRTPQ